MGLIEIMSVHTHTHATDTHKHLTRTLQISLSRLWREQTHRWNFKHSLYFSSSDMLRKKEEKNPTKNKYQLRLQSVQLSSPVYKTNQPVLLAQGLPIFSLARCSAPTVRRRHERRTRSSSKDGFVFAICVDLARSNVFTERSIPKLQGPTLSKMNNLIMITLNFLFCYNCLCNILPEWFFFFFFFSLCQIDTTGIKVALLVYFTVMTKWI